MAFLERERKISSIQRHFVGIGPQASYGAKVCNPSQVAIGAAKTDDGFV